jgi:RNA recognition motif-containing protein
MSAKIYVGNINYRTTEEGLQTLFADYGNVVSVKVITDRETGKPRGFAFVEMETEAEAEAAINALDKREFEGRMLRVNKANDRRDEGFRRPSYRRDDDRSDMY